MNIGLKDFFYQDFGLQTGDLIPLSIAVAGDLILIGIWWYMRKANSGIKREVGNYLMWWFIGSLAESVVSFFVPLLSFLLLPLPLVLVGWQVSQTHPEYSILKIVIETVVIAMVNFILSLLVALIGLIPSLIAEVMSAVLGAIASVVVTIIASFVVYYVLHKFVLKWLHGQLKA